MEGWITLHRKFLTWEWFEKSEMVQLFIWLLLNANYADAKWQGVIIKRGQVLTTTSKIMEALRLSEQQARTCISRLKSTGEITCKSTNRYTIITICNYDRYQDDNFRNNEQNNEQTNTLATDEQRTSNGHNNNNNNITIKKLNNNNNNNNARICEDREKIFELFFFRNFAEPESEVQRFYDHYDASGWVRASGIEIEDKLAAARLWKPKNEAQRFLPAWLDIIKEVYMEFPEQQQAVAMLHGIRDIADLGEGGVQITCANKTTYEAIEAFGKDIIVKRTGKHLHYRVAKRAN